MTNDEAVTPETQPTPSPAPTEEPKAFTQAELDKVISDRLAKQERAFQRQLSEMESKHQTEIKRLGMDASERAKAEAEDERKALVERAEAAENALRLTRAEKELSDAGLPAELASLLLNGATDDKDIAKAVKLLSDASVERGNRLYAEKVGGRGAPTVPTSTGSDSWQDEIDKAMKI